MMVWTSVMGNGDGKEWKDSRNDCNIKLMTRYGVEKRERNEDDSLGLDLGIWVHSATVQ